MQKNQTLRKNILLLPSDYNRLTNTILDAKAEQYKIVKIQTYYLSLFFLFKVTFSIMEHKISLYFKQS